MPSPSPSPSDRVRSAHMPVPAGLRAAGANNSPQSRGFLEQMKKLSSSHPVGFKHSNIQIQFIPFTATILIRQFISLFILHSVPVLEKAFFRCEQHRFYSNRYTLTSNSTLLHKNSLHTPFEKQYLFFIFRCCFVQPYPFTLFIASHLVHSSQAIYH